MNPKINYQIIKLLNLWKVNFSLVKGFLAYELSTWQYQGSKVLCSKEKPKKLIIIIKQSY